MAQADALNPTDMSEFNFNFGQPNTQNELISSEADALRGNADDFLRQEATRAGQMALMGNGDTREDNGSLDSMGFDGGGGGGGGGGGAEDDDAISRALEAVLAPPSPTTETGAPEQGEGQRGDSDPGVPRSAEPMEEAAASATWRNFEKNVMRYFELREDADRLYKEAREREAEAKAAYDRAASSYGALNVATVTGRPTMEDYFGKQAKCRFPRVAALTGTTWKEVAINPGVRPGEIELRSVYDMVDSETRARMFQASGTGKEATVITTEDAIRAYLALTYDQVPQNVALVMRENQDNFTSVRLSRTALVQILRYAFEHFGEIDAAMRAPDVHDRTKEAYADMLSNPVAWNVEPDFEYMSDFMDMRTVIFDSGDFAQRVAVSGVVLRCFYGGDVLLDGNAKDLRLMGDDILSAMQDAMRTVAKQRSRLVASKKSFLPESAPDALTAGCNACSKGKKY